MTITRSSIGYDGTWFRLEALREDGSIVTSRLNVGSLTDQAHTDTTARLKNDYQNLRSWSTQSTAVFNGWTTGATYTATKDANLKEMFRRLGILLDRLADMLQAQNLDQ